MDITERFEKFHEHMLNSGNYSLESNNEKVCFDIELYLNKFQDIINDESTDTCICIEDSDEFCFINKINMQIASNCAFIFDANFDNSQIKFNNKHNIQFFSLNKKTDEELPLFTIIKDNYDMIMKIECIDPCKNFKIDISNYKIYKNSISIRFDYMSFF